MSGWRTCDISMETLYCLFVLYDEERTENISTDLKRTCRKKIPSGCQLIYCFRATRHHLFTHAVFWWVWRHISRRQQQLLCLCVIEWDVTSSAYTGPISPGHKRSTPGDRRHQKVTGSLAFSSPSARGFAPCGLKGLQEHSEFWHEFWDPWLWLGVSWTISEILSEFHFHLSFWYSSLSTFPFTERNSW